MALSQYHLNISSFLTPQLVSSINSLPITAKPHGIVSSLFPDLPFAIRPTVVGLTTLLKLLIKAGNDILVLETANNVWDLADLLS